MRHQASTLTVIATLSTLVLAAPSALGAVAADSTLGATDVPTASCGAFSIFVTASPGYTVPSAGVITSWRIRGGNAASVRTFKLGRPTGGEVEVVATSDQTPVPASGVTQQSVRMPARAGDVLGFSTVSGDTLCAISADSGYQYRFYPGDVPVGPAGGGTLGSGFKFDVAATLEPDADADGYGDTTQDACPSQATTQGACEDLTAPQTRIRSARADRLKGNARKAKVTVAFTANEAATFGCSVDGSAYKKCASPLVRRLGAGRHLVQVRATDAAGNTDASPGAARVRVKPAR